MSLFQPHYPNNEEEANSVATMIFHLFAFGSYASGLLGAALADSKAGPLGHHDCLMLIIRLLCPVFSYVTITIPGKYRTILYIGILYAVGQAILAVGALSIGEKTHMEPVRITMVMLMPVLMFMFQHFGVDAIQTFRSRLLAFS